MEEGAINNLEGEDSETQKSGMEGRPGLVPAKSVYCSINLLWKSLASSPYFKKWASAKSLNSSQ